MMCLPNTHIRTQKGKNILLFVYASYFAYMSIIKHMSFKNKMENLLSKDRKMSERVDIPIYGV